MRSVQKFFPAPGYIPKVRGYARDTHYTQVDANNSIHAQEERIRAYHQMRIKDKESPFLTGRGSEWDRVYAEPPTRGAHERPFKQRPVGSLLYAQMEPGDHLIVDTMRQLVFGREDFQLLMNHFREHGIRVHFVNLMGLSVDSESPGGDWFLKTVAMLNDFKSIQMSERYSLARARMRANGLHDGTHVPFFMYCSGGDPKKKAGSGHKLYLSQWAEECWQLIKDNSHMGVPGLLALLDTKGYCRWKASKSLKWTEGKLTGFRNFFLSWEHANRPPLGTFRNVDLLDRYELDVGPLARYKSDMGRWGKKQRGVSHGQDSPGEIRRRDVEQPPPGDRAGADAAMDKDGGDLPPLPLHD